jgi:hypothetical protein
MMTTQSNLFSKVLVVLVLLALSIAAVASPSNKWRLQFSGGAESDGTIVMLITPKDGTPIEASVAIKKGTGENAVAKAVVTGLKAQLPKDQYHVERDDGEDVLIKKKGRTPDFDFAVKSNDVKGVRISPEHE